MAGLASYFPHGFDLYVTRFQDFAPNYGEFWRQCPWCGWWDPAGDITNVLVYIEDRDSEMCRCSWCIWLDEPPFLAYMVGRPAFPPHVSIRAMEPHYDVLWHMCRWCGWCDSLVDGPDYIKELMEVEDYPCLSRCDRCQQFDEPPWWPNNRQRCAKQLIHLLPTVRTTITATDIVVRTIPDETVRLIAEYLAENTT